MGGAWENPLSLESKSYICGYCNVSIASEKGYSAEKCTASYPSARAYIYICHLCQQPTYFSPHGYQTPSPAFGDSVKHLPKEVEVLYNEARNCLKVNATTAAILCCRKLLMNIAVSHGAKEGLNFIEYIDYLSDKGFVPPNGKDWVDHIRTKGNEATHEIKVMSRPDAEELITFIGMLLKFIYEFPETMKKKKTP